jgi:hypothetical protein
MRGFTQNRQIGTALPLAVMNRIPRQNGGYARGCHSYSTTHRGQYQACCAAVNPAGHVVP